MGLNLSKKFAMLCSCLLTMQALRLVISTAGFCAVRFHIDCSLFNIFISRLVNAVLMSQLFGNWLGDLIVFATGARLRLISLTLAFWAEFICFCTALHCICAGEQGKLTGFYWSMVIAYFWWKVGEAPTIGIAVESADYYFAGFTLSGVWSACLKGLVMRCVTGDAKKQSFHSVPLGDVNVTLVGYRSVKTSVDYRAAKWLYIITIVLTCFLCIEWSVVTGAIGWVTGEVKGSASNTKKEGATTPTFEIGLGWGSGFVLGSVLSVPGAMLGVGVGWLFGLCCCLGQKWCQLIFGIVGALGGMAAGVAGVGLPNMKAVKQDQEPSKDVWKQGKAWDWTEYKWGKGEWSDGVGNLETWAPMIGLGAGTVTGALVGATRSETDEVTLSNVASGAFIGGFFGLWFGEIGNGDKTWAKTGSGALSGWGTTDTERIVIICFGFFIVVGGLGTVYSIYPGMAPCSITQFQYFNIIDILILILSSSGPLVTMGLDLGEVDVRLLGAIRRKTAEKDTTSDKPIIAWVFMGVVLTIATLICEIIVISVLQHPFSKTAQKVTTSGWRAVLLTVTMVTCQLVSTGVGFGCVFAGSGFNDGVYNALSTVTLWSTECCGVLGEGYLTELKKYEPGKWPTQGLGKWETYRWWNGKAFGNAWAIWCCIGTTDLRRDIMLCRQ